MSKNKWLLSFLVLIFMLGTSLFSVEAANNEVILKTQVPPINVGGTTLVPFRVVTEWLGVNISFNANTKCITATGRGHTVTFTAGSVDATVDNIPQKLAVPVVIYQGSTLVPIRFLAESFGVVLHWQDNPAEIILKIDGKVARLPIPAASSATLAAINASIVATPVKVVPMGGVYKVAVHTEPITNNIIAALGTNATTSDFAILLPQYSTLYGVAAPRFDYAPALAAGDPGPFQKEVKGGVTYYTSVIPLRKDLLWSDRTKFTSADVVFTYESILKIGPEKLSGNWESMINKEVIYKVEALDDYTVKFWLKKQPGLSEWQYNALQTIVLNKKHWTPIFDKAYKSADPAKTIYEYNDSKPVTIGGFVGGRWENGAFYEIKKDTNSVFPYEDVTFFQSGGLQIKNSKTSYIYTSGSGAIEMVVKGGPTIDNAIYRLYLNQNAAITALQMGEVDYWLNATGLTKGALAQLERNPKITVVQNPQNGFRFLGFNIAREPFDNKAFRQAVATVIDREWVANNVLQGAIEPVASVVPPGNAFWYNKEIKIWGDGLDEYGRLNEAVRILKAAGYTWDKEPKVVSARGGQAVVAGEGLKDPSGKHVRRIELIAPTAGYDPLRASFALWVKQWIANLGVDVREKLVDFNVIVDRQNNREYDMVIFGWGLGIYPDHMKDFFHSESSWNLGSYKNPTFDKVVEEFTNATDLTQARRLAFKCQEILAEDVPYVVLYTTPIIEAYRNDRVQYEYTQVLDGLQSLYGLPNFVHVQQ